MYPDTGNTTLSQSARRDAFCSRTTVYPWSGGYPGYWDDRSVQLPLDVCHTSWLRYWSLYRVTTRYALVGTIFDHDAICKKMSLEKRERYCGEFLSFFFCDHECSRSRADRSQKWYLPYTLDLLSQAYYQSSQYLWTIFSYKCLGRCPRNTTTKKSCLLYAWRRSRMNHRCAYILATPPQCHNTILPLAKDTQKI